MCMWYFSNLRCQGNFNCRTHFTMIYSEHQEKHPDCSICTPNMYKYMYSYPTWTEFNLDERIALRNTIQLHDVQLCIGQQNTVHVGLYWNHFIKKHKSHSIEFSNDKREKKQFFAAIWCRSLEYTLQFSVVSLMYSPIQSAKHIVFWLYPVWE